ncbi:N-acetylglutaminylglutamine synthetase [Marinobacterium mangrovicola]|uniref:GNAT-family acetyltransferase (TIGR03103 family) n=1 Tax=Marinobacterium mangrovicola TaxID=1476959 RepID=A0A4R1G7R2_9GAMM|nr:N-acetylglutaminylglutamine synthetase [Marinobacterium mangrovicola]TCK02570.1 GNAT-family acetyltransferase (TIGR03103 family) [Marinobacterium mangrovicola]
MTKKPEQDSAQQKERQNPMDPSAMASLKHWGDPLDLPGEKMREEVALDCGWGRLIFGQTFRDPQKLAQLLRKEREGRRDIALYVREPHVVLSYAPQDLFMDPSLTYRLDFTHYKQRDDLPEGMRIREITAEDDQRRINRLHMARHMVPAYDGFYSKLPDKPELTVLVAEEVASGEIIGVVTGVDHREAINDPDNGCSLWALVSDPQAQIPSVGEWLSRALIELMRDRGRAFMDLSVMHDNHAAIHLYDKLNFEQVPVYCLKHKNSINEKLFIGQDPEEELNVYARLITKEARRRGIGVEVLDAEGGFFRLSLGGRWVTCRESLSEMTSAVAMSRCDDKAVTRRLLQKEGLRVPEQLVVSDEAGIENFLSRHQAVVVKPARGEQGRGIQVGLSSLDEVSKAVDSARFYCDKVLLEQCVKGEDLRIIVIDYKVVAAAVRRPPKIIGDGDQTIGELIERLSRRRAAATDGESTIPLDAETERCVARAGYRFDDILPRGEWLQVRTTANLHTGGTIHDVTGELHPVLSSAAIRAAKAIEIPVVGLDFMVPDVSGPDYAIIEANERPGLANHEPQPTVECFVDLLFPHTRSQKERSNK